MDAVPPVHMFMDPVHGPGVQVVVLTRLILVVAQHRNHEKICHADTSPSKITEALPIHV